MTQAERSLYVVGAFSEGAVRCIDEAAASVGVTPAYVGGCEHAPSALAEAHDPLAIVLQMDADGARGACAHVRGQARLAKLPVLCIAPQRDDIAFTELFSWGGDDLLTLTSPPSLARRLRPLVSKLPDRRAPKSAERDASSEAPPERSAIVAGADSQWRSVMGRALYQGGFSVRFVSGAEDLIKESLGQGVRVVVVADDVDVTGVETILAKARSLGSGAAWIVVAPPKRMASLHAAIGALPKVSVADGYAPPENVLFLTNELLGRRGVDQRASARVLYGTGVDFRLSGRDEDEIGFSYNVSAGGLYVRTLAPLDAGQELWLEMWPPRAERRVRLAGTVAWKRPFGPNEGATVPAGFGVQITDGLAGDLDRWRAGYDVFAKSVLGAGAVKS